MDNFGFRLLKFAAPFALALSVAGLPSLAQAQAVATGSVVSVGPARSVVLSQLPLARGQPTVRTLPAISEFTAAQMATLKSQAAAMRGKPIAAALPPLMAASTGGVKTVTPDVSFDGDSQSEVACGGVTPADQALAIGDNANPVLQAVNLCLSVWSPAGARLYGPVTLSSFFGVPVSSTIVSDPRALYDWYNHRFIVTMLDSDGTTNAYYDVAVSKTDDPTGAWWTYRIHTKNNNVLNDFPRVGQDHAATYPVAAQYTAYPGAIYLASNLFQMNGSCCGAYVSEEWVILGKAQLYNGLTPNAYFFNNVKNPDNSTAFTSQPVDVWSPYEAPRSEFFVESGASKSLIVFSISNPFGYAIAGSPLPELSSVSVATTNTFSVPPAAVQKTGGTATIDTGDTRISGEVTYNAGYLHAALSTANGTGGTASIVYKVHPILNANDNAKCTGAYVNACPQITAATIVDESVLNYGTNYSAFYATPQPDMEGDVTTVYGYASPNDYGSLAYIQQRVTQAQGFASGQPGAILKAGTAYYQNQNGGGTVSRWGDYTAVAPAGVGYTPTFVSNTGVGFSGMYAVPGNCFGSASGCWNTRIGYVQFTDPTQP
jgi:hypothetical protein